MARSTYCDDELRSFTTGSHNDEALAKTRDRLRRYECDNATAIGLVKRLGIHRSYTRLVCWRAGQRGVSEEQEMVAGSRHVSGLSGLLAGWSGVELSRVVCV